MTLITLIAAAGWLFGIPLIFIVVFAVCQWRDRRRRQADERGLTLFVVLEQPSGSEPDAPWWWELPPAERRDG